MSEVKTATLNGTRYKVTVGEFDGLCDTYATEMELVILTDLKTKLGLETVIHESLHGCRWPATEEDVTQTAKDIARLLWRLGYRRVK